MTVAISFHYTFDSSSERQVLHVQLSGTNFHSKFSTQYLTHPFIFFSQMDEQPGRDLQQLFYDAFLIQRYIQQLNQAEEHLIEISDLFDHEALAGPARIIENIRLQIQQLRVNLNFLSSMKLLHACRQVQRHLQVHGNLPLFNLDFN